MDKLNFEALRKEARTGLKEVAKRKGILLGPGVVNAVDTFLIWRRNAILTAWQGRSLSLEVWRRHVRQVSERVADHLRDQGRFSIHRPQQLAELARVQVQAYPY